MNLVKFLILAKTNTYASNGEGGEEVLSDRSKELEFEEKGFKYRDRYFGSNPFIGEEIVWSGEDRIWGMNYYGAVSSEEVSEEEIYEFLKKAMRRVSEKRPFRGPDNFKEGDFEYIDKSNGDIKMFSGVEKIFFKGKEIYRLYYHGGCL